MREGLIARRFLFQPFFVLGLCSAGGACDSKLQSPTNSTITPAPVTPAITVLRIICDIPAELENPKRIVNGHIGWSDKNITTGETFSFELAQPMVELPLTERIPIDEKIHIRFVVQGSPGFNTKFKSGDWFLYRKIHDESSREVLVVYLSSFRTLTTSYIRSIAPEVTDKFGHCVELE